MFRKTLLMLALVAAPALAAAQQPTQQPTPAPAHKARMTSAQRADTSRAKAHRRRRARKAQGAAPRDTTKAKP